MVARLPVCVGAGRRCRHKPTRRGRANGHGARFRVAWKMRPDCEKPHRPGGDDALLAPLHRARPRRARVLTAVERDPIASARRAALRSTPGRSVAYATGAWAESTGSVGGLTDGFAADCEVTQGFSAESATHHLFAALSTRQSTQDGRDAAVVGRAAFDAVARAMASALDRLNVAVCAFDADDRTAFWNDTYLRFFPE